MLDSDEIVVFVVDENGKQIEKHGPVQWSRTDLLTEGNHIALSLGGGKRYFRVLATRPGEGLGLFVQVIEDLLMCPFCGGALRAEHGLAGLTQDAKGVFVPCRHCRKRVELQQVGAGPATFRVAPGQGT